MYVRKVLVVLDLKGIPYEVDPIIPFYGSDRFSLISLVRRIPVLMDDQVTLPDSSVICQYLEDRYSERLFYRFRLELEKSRTLGEEMLAAAQVHDPDKLGAAHFGVAETLMESGEVRTGSWASGESAYVSRIGRDCGGSGNRHPASAPCTICVDTLDTRVPGVAHAV